MENKPFKEWWLLIGSEKATELRNKYYPGEVILNHFQIETIYLSETKKEESENEDKEIEKLQNDLYNSPTGTPPIKMDSSSVISLEDAANDYSINIYENISFPFQLIQKDALLMSKNDFKEGANWQKEQVVIIIRQLLEAVKIQETSLLTYGKHPLIEMQVNDAIQKATKFLNK